MRSTYAFLAACLAVTVVRAAAVAVVNASFEDGEASPAGWHSDSTTSRWHADGGVDGGRFVSVEGSGTDNTYWRSAAIEFEAGKLYRLSFQSRQLGASSGTAVTGPVFCNWDIGCPGESWRSYSTVFSCPDNLSTDQSWLRFGQWHVNGRIAFDDIRVISVEPVYSRHGDVVLGDGEILDGQRYRFTAPLGGSGRNHSRPLAENYCGFNTNRWVFGASSRVVYRHGLSGRRLQGGTVSITVGWHAGGQLVVAARADGGPWHSLGGLQESGVLDVDLPEALFPADEIAVRLSAQAKEAVGAADSDPGSFQVHGYQFRGAVSGSPVSARGATRYVEVSGPGPGFAVTITALGDAVPGAGNRASLRVRNALDRAVTLRPEWSVTAVDGGTSATMAGAEVMLEPGSADLLIPYELPGPGHWVVGLALRGAAGWSASVPVYVPDFYATHYGSLLPASTEAVALWSASSGWKIPRRRPLPSSRASGLVVRAAANEAEAVQLVVRPEAPLSGLRITAGALSGPGGASLPARQIEILEVGYVPVERPTDATGAVADWPDPLPPLRGALDLEGGVNQPLWIRVKVPPGTPAGRYHGRIDLSAPGYRAQVPLEVAVYGFELPTRMTCETAFGFSPGNVWRYHNLSSPSQRREVLEKYWQTFSDHHISPYDPAPLDRFTVSWPTLGGWHGGSRDDQVRFSGESSLRIQDDSDTANVSARYAETLIIPDAGVRFRFRYRTDAPGHSFIVSFMHHDEAGQWLSGRNRDMVVEGDGSWQIFDRTITSFPRGAQAFRLTLWATLYAEDGHYTGTVWYDDLNLTTLDTGASLVRGGDFEPVDVTELQPSFDWAAWDRALTRAFAVYGFNTVRMPIMGLGGGTFHSRREPELLGYAADTPEYRAAMSSYLGAIEAHLRDRGWLDKAYVYWFDEPAPKDYEFVMNGFRTLKQWAPGLRRMLTEQVEDALIGGPNLWCPVSPRFDLERAEERRQAGEQFWWYVCTGPKAPYCTLFIDHPGTELRVWLWQTWKRRISGILVWQTNYWTSSCAYPDPEHPQNPYADPMAWVSGYSTPKGTKRPWGNGDGRFIYPPVAAADAHPEGPVLDGPVDSIRWEMLRDGIEDYEYFVMLQQLLEQHKERLAPADRERYEALLAVPASVSADMTSFTRDPAPLEAHRHALGNAIGTLSREGFRRMP